MTLGRDGVIAKKLRIAGAVLLCLLGFGTLCWAQGDIRREDMVQFLSLLDADFDAAKTERIVRFANDPNGTYAAHRAEMEENGFEGPYATIYLDIVIDHMSERERLVRLDWKASRDEISWAVEVLSKERFKGLLDDRGENDAITGLLAEASNRLAKQGYALMFVDDGSDSYPTILVPKKTEKNLTDAAEKCGVRVVSVKDA